MRVFRLATFLPILLPSAIRWAERASHRALHDAELELARQVGVSRPEDIRLQVVDVMPRPYNPLLFLAAHATGFLGDGVTGLTLGHAVLVRSGHVSRRLLAHEFRHVQQYEQAGSVDAFLCCYLHQVADVGYFNAPLEIDARQHERYSPFSG